MNEKVLAPLAPKGTSRRSEKGDAAQPATLNDGVGGQTDFSTLEAAIVAWRALPSAQKIRATVTVYRAQQIERLRYAPKSGTAE